MELLFHPAAADEAEAAERWYADRSEVAAQAFQRAIDAGIDSILEAPTRWPPAEHKTQRRRLHRFPFDIVYLHNADQERVVVVAVAHQRRRPGYWRRRLTS